MSHSAKSGSCASEELGLALMMIGRWVLRSSQLRLVFAASNDSKRNAVLSLSPYPKLWSHPVQKHRREAAPRKCSQVRKSALSRTQSRSGEMTKSPGSGRKARRSIWTGTRGRRPALKQSVTKTLSAPSLRSLYIPSRLRTIRILTSLLAMTKVRLKARELKSHKVNTTRSLCRASHLPVVVVS